ncbi:MAG: M17 family peptidase N-terminal domain-containing protein, partial [Alphaproteobacteria bacterium]|nr:M17 family peptidase N-terminal domain-containing protein [Alphaproteobacteria bacterium]
MLKITYVSEAVPSEGALILTVAADRKLGNRGSKLDAKLGGVIKRAMASGKFDGSHGQVLSIVSPAKTRLQRILLLGIGAPKDVEEI